ncbi:unnamed protein product, partial [Vitis vinifera]
MKNKSRKNERKINSIISKHQAWESWTPRTTGRGMKERRGSEMATTAMDFMGWTGIGMLKRKPMEML